jgi:hypothetical protein
VEHAPRYRNAVLPRPTGGVQCPVAASIDNNIISSSCHDQNDSPKISFCLGYEKMRWLLCTLKMRCLTTTAGFQCDANQLLTCRILSRGFSEGAYSIIPFASARDGCVTASEFCFPQFHSTTIDFVKQIGTGRFISLLSS